MADERVEEVVQRLELGHVLQRDRRWVVATLAQPLSVGEAAHVQPHVRKEELADAEVLRVLDRVAHLLRAYALVQMLGDDGREGVERPLHVRQIHQLLRAGVRRALPVAQPHSHQQRVLEPRRHALVEVARRLAEEEARALTCVDLGVRRVEVLELAQLGRHVQLPRVVWLIESGAERVQPARALQDDAVEARGDVLVRVLRELERAVERVLVVDGHEHHVDARLRVGEHAEHLAHARVLDAFDLVDSRLVGLVAVDAERLLLLLGDGVLDDEVDPRGRRHVPLVGDEVVAPALLHAARRLAQRA